MSGMLDIAKEAGEKLVEILNAARAEGKPVAVAVLKGAQELAAKGLPMAEKLSIQVAGVITEIGKDLPGIGQEIMQGFNSALQIAGPVAMVAYEKVLEAIKAAWGELQVLAPKVWDVAKVGGAASY